LSGERGASIEELVETRGGKIFNEESGSVIAAFTGDTAATELKRSTFQ